MARWTRYLLFVAVAATSFHLVAVIAFGGISNVTATVEPALHNAYWLLTGTSYTVANLSVSTTVRLENGSAASNNVTRPAVRATVFDSTVEANDPAVIQLAVHNDEPRPLQIGAGVFWPFDMLFVDSGTGDSFMLWSEFYEEALQRDVPGYRITVVPAVATINHLAPGDAVRRNYTIEAGTGDITPGEYSGTESFTFRWGASDINVSEPRDSPLLLTGTGYTLRYTLDFQLH